MWQLQRRLLPDCDARRKALRDCLLGWTDQTLRALLKAVHVKVKGDQESLRNKAKQSDERPLNVFFQPQAEEKTENRPLRHCPFVILAICEMALSPEKISPHPRTFDPTRHWPGAVRPASLEMFGLVRRLASWQLCGFGMSRVVD